MKEENLIFIVSQPRAGSTYLQNLLSNNKEVNTCSEPWILLNFVNQLKPELVRSKIDNQLAIGALHNYLKKYSNFNYQTCLKNYLLSLYSPLSGDYQFVIDKTPRYWEILDEIIELFPNCKLIVLHRNPINVLKSIITTWRLTSFKELNLFRRDLLYAPKKLHNFCEKHENNKNVYSLNYEFLIENTSFELEKIYKWIGIPFNESVLKTDSNIKYKGEYGDPFQNSRDGYSKTKKKLQATTISKPFKNLIIGYGKFLGKDFLQNYGYEKLPKFKSTLAFNYFLHLREDDERSFATSKNFKWYVKHYFYKIMFGN